MIKELKDNVLRNKAIPVIKINDDIKNLLNDMIDTMRFNNGVGLAAPQIGISLQLIVIEFENKIYKLINPQIISQEGSQNSKEGCLSIKGIQGKVRRPERIHVKALNEDGEEIEIISRNALACILSHEIDHLNGILFIDKLKKY